MKYIKNMFPQKMHASPVDREQKIRAGLLQFATTMVAGCIFFYGPANTYYLFDGESKASFCIIYRSGTLGDITSADVNSLRNSRDLLRTWNPNGFGMRKKVKNLEKAVDAQINAITENQNIEKSMMDLFKANTKVDDTCKN